MTEAPHPPTTDDAGSAGGFPPALDLTALGSRPGLKWQRRRGGIAAWVADMDWPIAPAIADRLDAVLAAGDLGYPDWNTTTWQSPAVEAFVARMADRYGWTIAADECWEWNDVVQAVRVVAHLRTAPGERIVVHVPSYPPFGGTVDWTGPDRARRLQPVHATTDGRRWHFDYERLEAELADPELPAARLWILCHPHNPLGHVFERSELERIATIAERFDLTVVSDEIHADLTFPRPGIDPPHVPFAALSSDTAARTVTITSASKAFNLAGLRWAIAHVGDATLRDGLDEYPSHFFGAPNLFAVEAACAAWTSPDAQRWLDAVVAQIESNSRLVSELLAEHLPAVRYTPNRATYLAWLDVRDHVPAAEHPVRWYRSRGVELSNGADFDPDGGGRVRLNMATDPALITEIVERLGRS